MAISESDLLLISTALGGYRAFSTGSVPRAGMEAVDFVEHGVMPKADANTSVEDVLQRFETLKVLHESRRALRAASFAEDIADAVNNPNLSKSLTLPLDVLAVASYANDKLGKLPVPSLSSLPAIFPVKSFLR